MYRDDYILRMIAQFGAIIRYILGLYRDGKSPLVRIAIDNAYRDRLGIGSDHVASLSDRQLLALLRFHNQSEDWWSEGAYLAALLTIEARLLSDDGESDAAAARALLALQLLTECGLAAPNSLPDYAPAYTDVLTFLREYVIPETTLAALLTWCERIGDLSRGEDIVHELLGRDPYRWLATARAFYQRLLAHSDDELIAAGLSRAEALAGYAELDRIAPPAHPPMA
ncbi:MAG: hypothetical protein KatS3mg055_0575 [Chloroflexus sp.]|uniref:DUF6483 family protein n=1 Tax=Chloroflexus sp. TaxID=1904827 RepID=UPI0021DB970E|nr:DUF6483 family protein [Chloroflexus sp.]GIV88057.1 MAG: hypothetical protein KatS3mg055_0575 [Chloroflexus sp.]